MKSSVENLEGHKVRLSVELEPEEFEADLSAMFKKLSLEVKLPGFRKGKAPRKVLETRLGAEYTRTRALEEALPKYYSEAIRVNQVDAISEPEVELTSDVSDTVMSFEAVVEVRPEVRVAGYSSLRVEVPDPEPTEDELSAEIDRFREHFGTLETVTRPAREKDRLTLDLLATYNGEPFTPFEAKDYTYVVGSGSTGFEDFDKQLIGSQAGHIFEFNAPHPQEDATLVRVKSLVKEVQQNNLPELTDEFVEESSEFDTVDELKAEFSQQLSQAKRQHSARSFTQRTEDALNLLVDEQLPEALISSMTQQAARNLVTSLQSIGMDLAKYLEATNQTPESFSATIRSEGEKMAKLDVALRAVAKAESLDVSDDELYEAYDSILAQQQARQQGDTADSTPPATANSSPEAETAKPPIENLQGLRVELLKRNAFEWVCHRVEIVDEAGNPIQYEQLFPESNEEQSESEDETGTSETESADSGGALAEDNTTSSEVGSGAEDTMSAASEDAQEATKE